MAVLHLASGKLVLVFEGTTIASSVLRYDVADTTAPTLSKRGTVEVPLSDAIKRQIEQTVQDTLMTEGVL